MRCASQHPELGAQSPEWFSRMTEWPRNSSSRQTLSLLMVLLKVPHVHLLGNVRRRKSKITFFLAPTGGGLTLLQHLVQLFLHHFLFRRC